MEIALELIPPEPPVADPCCQNGAQRARTRRFAQRSAPLRASTVLALTRDVDGRRRCDERLIPLVISVVLP